MNAVASPAELAPSNGGEFVAAVTLDGDVRVYDVAAGTFESLHVRPYDFGGRRIAVTSDGKSLAAAAYAVHGMAAFRVANGDALWTRRDLKKVQSVTWSFDDRIVFACIEGRGCFLLDGRDGKGCGHWRGVRAVFPDWQADRVLRVSRTAIELVAGKSDVLGKDRPSTFAALSAAFGSTTVALSEAGGAVRIFSRSPFRQIGSHAPPAGAHVLRLAFDPAAEVFRAIEWPYVAGGDSRLLTLEQDMGRVIAERTIPSAAASEFCLSGSHVLLSTGQLLNASGEVVTRLWDRRA